MKTNNSVFHIIENFISEKDAKQFIDFFNTNEHLCTDVEEEHKHRNIHYAYIKNEKMGCENSSFQMEKLSAGMGTPLQE